MKNYPIKCDIIIPVWNQPKSTAECVKHIIDNTRYPYRLILIDNGSDSATKDYLEGLKNERKIEVYLIRNERNIGFVKAVNQGLKVSDALYICVLNNDTLPANGWLTELIRFAEKNPETGLLNPLCNGHKEQNLSLNEYAHIVSVSNRGKFMEMNQCQGFCMLIKREVVDKIGYLDEGFGLGGFDDTDYSMRAQKAAYRSVCVYSSYVYHKEHESFDVLGERKSLQIFSEKEYFKKWPRHLRLFMSISVSGKTERNEIINFLKILLYLAREWCWINIFIFGDRKIRQRMETVKKEINFPLHQNIKYNYSNRWIGVAEIFIRTIERLYGSKAGKKYDAYLYNSEKASIFMNAAAALHNCEAIPLNFKAYPEDELKKLVLSLRGRTRSDNSVKCDIILPVCDQYEFTKKCVESIIKNTDTPYRLIIINNGKNLDTKTYIETLKRNNAIDLTIIENDYNIGWVKALNKGMELSKAPYICFQNDDTVVTKGWIRKMINILNLDEKFGIINPFWEGRPRGISIDKYNTIIEKKAKGAFIETDWCRGFSVVLKRAVIEKIGKVDEVYGLGYFDDVDYSVTAIEAGFTALKALDTYVYHHRNVSAFQVLKGPKWKELHEKNKFIYYKKWGRPLKVALVLDKKNIINKKSFNDLISTVFSLARKQHSIYIWSPVPGIRKKFRHTNIIFRSYPFGLHDKLIFLNLSSGLKRKKGKKYDAVFIYGKESVNNRLTARLGDTAVFSDNNAGNFNDFIKRTVSEIKEKTKDAVHA